MYVIKCSKFILRWVESFMGVNVEIQVLYTEIPKEKPYASCFFMAGRKILNFRQDLTSRQS